jgi:hypothetical protein
LMKSENLSPLTLNLILFAIVNHIDFDT